MDVRHLRLVVVSGAVVPPATEGVVELPENTVQFSIRVAAEAAIVFGMNPGEAIGRGAGSFVVDSASEYRSPYWLRLVAPLRLYHTAAALGDFAVLYWVEG